jgi:hypothetical protein
MPNEQRPFSQNLDQHLINAKRTKTLLTKS